MLDNYSGFFKRNDFDNYASLIFAKKKKRLDFFFHKNVLRITLEAGHYHIGNSKNY